jgi:hypothetical protein
MIVDHQTKGVDIDGGKIVQPIFLDVVQKNVVHSSYFWRIVGKPFFKCGSYIAFDMQKISIKRVK